MTASPILHHDPSHFAASHVPLSYPRPCRSPYDTMEEVIGTRGTPGHGSLMEWGVTYRELPLGEGGQIDWEALKAAIKPGGCWWCLW